MICTTPTSRGTRYTNNNDDDNNNNNNNRSYIRNAVAVSVTKKLFSNYASNYASDRVYQRHCHRLSSSLPSQYVRAPIDGSLVAVDECGGQQASPAPGQWWSVAGWTDGPTSQRTQNDCLYQHRRYSIRDTQWRQSIEEIHHIRSQPFMSLIGWTSHVFIWQQQSWHSYFLELCTVRYNTTPRFWGCMSVDADVSLQERYFLRK